MGALLEMPVPLPNVELVETDGEPLDSAWHRDAMNFLVEIVRWFCRDRTDFYVGGNMFIYFSEEQARNRDFRGPDFFFVDGGVQAMPPRRWWAIWQESGRYPDLIMELLSPSTAETDRTVKKNIYEKTFKTFEYFCYDPDSRTFEGWRLVDGAYEEIKPADNGRFYCKQLDLWLGIWEGEYQGVHGVWPRFFDHEGRLILSFDEAAEERARQERQVAEVERQRAEAERERAEAEHQRAEAERVRAEAAEAELARLKAKLGE